MSPVRNADGEIVSYIAVKEDITERKRTELELLRVNRTLRMVSECNQVLVVAKDESHLLQSICRAIVRTGGYARAHVTLAGSDAPAASAAEGRDSPDASASLALVLRKDRQVFGTLTIRASEPAFTLEEHELLREMADDLAYGIGALRVAQMHERDLAHRAHHDPLTGLANRNLLDDRLEQAVAAARRYGRPMAVVYLDLDHFKIVNDSL